MRTTKPGHCAHAELTLEQRVALREAQDLGAMTVRSDTTISCSRCSAYGSCGDCARINLVRLTAGLIENKDDHTDHANNICLSPMSGTFRGYRPMKYTRKSAVGIAAKVVKLGGGWRQGVAMIGGKVLYRGPATRSQDEAWQFASSRLAVIRMGM